jgi:hypothetical protein
MHIRQNVLDDKDNIDPFKLDAIGRLGGERYVRVNGEAVFTVPKPRVPGIGFDNLPAEVRESRVLTGHDLAMLASVPAMPEWPVKIGGHGDKHEVHRQAQHRLAQGDIEGAWKVLLA